MDTANPITQAEEAETVYENSGDDSKYILIQLEGSEEPDTLTLKVNVEGIPKEQVALILREVASTMEAEIMAEQSA